MQFVLNLGDPQATLPVVGGKGASLARMVAAGLPVPPGFHITTAAYQRFVEAHGLQPQIAAILAATAPGDLAALAATATQIAELFTLPMPADVDAAVRAAYATLRDGSAAVAVRSSATAEDLPDLSFAGQQETFLNISGADPLLDAVRRCWASLWAARAIDYRRRNGIDADGAAMAVVVQILVPAESAGVLFTADPLTGARGRMLINAAWGLGEAVVGGQVSPDTIMVDMASGEVQLQIQAKQVMTVLVPGGTSEVPVPVAQQRVSALNRPQAANLARLGTQIEELYGRPMDVEWALHQGQLYILQARPITVLAAPIIPEVWNDSLSGTFLWTKGNVGEAVPDVMTPCTWSLVQIFIADSLPVPPIAGHSMIGNIGGRFYLNLSVTFSLAAAFGVGHKMFIGTVEEAFGRLPADLPIPLLPVSRWRILRTLLGVAVHVRLRVRANARRIPAFLVSAPDRCAELRDRIATIDDPAALIALWHSDLLPFFHECGHMLEAGARLDGASLSTLRRRLSREVGEDDANALLSGLHTGVGQMASLGPLLGLAQLARGEIDQATYGLQYGHRSPHEFEVSAPRPAEDPAWIAQQLASLHDAPLDVAALLARRRAAHDDALQQLRLRTPRRADALSRRIDRTAAAFRAREGARSEVVRVFWALRVFVLRAGTLTEQNDDIFFLSIMEILALLAGDTTPLAAIPARRAAYEGYTALPPYPVLIRGPFDPQRWAADPARRGDIFDAGNVRQPTHAAITGFPGAVGIVEGRARVLATAEQGDQLRVGEILVTTVTNIGWTPLFPRAAAVVTDVGAPLSHAAIVARELGIPAVVGCGDATMRLRTGDLLRVDGGKGTVEVLAEA